MQAVVGANNQAMHGSLAAKVIPSDPVVRDQLGGALRSPGGLLALNGEITRQAAMVAYVDAFKMMFIVTLACMPMLLLMRGPKRKPGEEPVNVVID